MIVTKKAANFRRGISRRDRWIKPRAASSASDTIFPGYRSIFSSAVISVQDPAWACATYPANRAVGIA